MSVSKKDRLKYLCVRLEDMKNQIQDAKREDEYLALVKKMASGAEKPSAIDEDEWNLMLPKEKELNLLLHYHSLRTEASQLFEDLKKVTVTQTLKDWLESPYVKGPILFASLVSVAVHVIELAQHAGLFFREDEQLDKTFFV
ncbi:MAG: hypothetical protein WB930_03640 [Syntrophobacteraceae bacterium]